MDKTIRQICIRQVERLKVKDICDIGPMIIKSLHAQRYKSMEINRMDDVFICPNVTDVSC